MHCKYDDCILNSIECATSSLWACVSPTSRQCQEVCYGVKSRVSPWSSPPPPSTDVPLDSSPTIKSSTPLNLSQFKKGARGLNCLWFWNFNFEFSATLSPSVVIELAEAWRVGRRCEHWNEVVSLRRAPIFRLRDSGCFIFPSIYLSNFYHSYCSQPREYCEVCRKVEWSLF